MDSGFYAACTALVARTQALDSIANNLANANTTGFRAERNQFKSILATASSTGSSPLNLAVNNYAVMGGTHLNLQSGSLNTTGNDLDLAINGSGFFTVQTAAGQMYTRAGNFRLSSTGQLVTQAGDAVLGENGPINVSGGKAYVCSDGTVSVDGAVVDRIKVVDFSDTSQLAAAGKSYYSAPEGSATVAADATVKQGVLEDSNVDPVSSAVELINVQRQAEMMQRALSFFNNDLNKTATEDLPRVNS